MLGGQGDHRAGVVAGQRLGDSAVPPGVGGDLVAGLHVLDGNGAPVDEDRGASGEARTRIQMGAPRPTGEGLSVDLFRGVLRRTHGIEGLGPADRQRPGETTREASLRRLHHAAGSFAGIVAHDHAPRELRLDRQ